MQSCAIDSQQGYLDVAVAKKNISETCEKWSRKYLVSESWGAPLIPGAREIGKKKNANYLAFKELISKGFFPL